MENIGAIIYLCIFVVLAIVIGIYCLYIELLKNKKRKDFLSKCSEQEKLLIMSYCDAQRIDSDDFNKKEKVKKDESK